MNKLFINQPAIEYTDPKTGDIRLFMGYSHDDAYNYAAGAYDLYLRCIPECCREGYLISDGSFRDRHEALQIAKDANQLKDMYNNATVYDLYSYMLKEDYQTCT